jgi:ubiquinol-cytochrome c reductase cytochrome b subunit
MRDVNYGWLVRYSHSNGASFFFICVYIHIARGLYYGSYTKPRVGLWTVGVIIYLLMTGIAFLGLIGPKWFDGSLLSWLEPVIINTVPGWILSLPLSGQTLSAARIEGLTLIPPLTAPSKFYQRLEKLRFVNVEPLAIILYPTKDTWQTSKVI